MSKPKRTGFRGMGKHPRYGVWNDMINRCDNPKCWNYKHYGGRGIKVCDGWYDFSTYLKDTERLDFSNGRTIDRIENDQGYFSENVRTATQTQQVTNQRMKKSNSSGAEGVYWDEHANKWRARISINGKRTNLGLFTDLDDATKVRHAWEYYRHYLIHPDATPPTKPMSTSTPCLGIEPSNDSLSSDIDSEIQLVPNPKPTDT